MINNVKLERIKHDLYQKDVSKYLEIDINTYGKKEKEPLKFTGMELIKLSKLFDKSIEYLLQ